MASAGLFASALCLLPAIAMAQTAQNGMNQTTSTMTAAPPAGTVTAAPGTTMNPNPNASPANGVNAGSSAGPGYPVPTASPGYVTTTTTETTRPSGGWWGWLGLIGLFGLFGLFGLARRSRPVV